MVRPDPPVTADDLNAIFAGTSTDAAPSPVAKRTQDEILARITEISAADFFGFRQEVLISGLDYEHAKQFLRDEVTAEDWAESAVIADVEASARAYYDFALGKIRHHRGISASRSSEKLLEYAWLMGRDDVVTAMGEADYAPYGAPQVKAFGAALGLEWPTDAAMIRMGEGLPCTLICDEGCTS